MRHFKTKTKVFISLIMCFCMIATILGTNGLSFISTKADEAVLNDESLHFMVRHWHTDTAIAAVEGSGHDSSVLIEGYIVPDSKGGYTFENVSADGEEMDVDNKDLSDTYHVQFNSADGSVTVGLMPLIKDKEVIEDFSGFTTSAGHDAVTEYEAGNDSTLTIRYTPDIHVAKAHIFYMSTREAQGTDFDGEDFQKEYGKADPEKDTYVESDGQKLYNTSEGLHTDKTAEAWEDGRTYDLNLEAWYAGDNVADVGLVLDASGSMAFVSESSDEGLDLQEMVLDLSDPEIQEILKGTSEDEALPATVVNQLLDRNYTDNSKLSYSDYSYYIYDFRDTTKEYVPLGYWNGEADSVPEALPAEKALLGYYSFEDGHVKNELNGTELKFVTQAVKNEGVFNKSEATSNTINTNSNGCNSFSTHSMNLTKTADLKGGLLLDVAPSSNSFTISFALKLNTKSDTTPGKATRHGNDSEFGGNHLTELFYIGNVSGKSGTYYSIARANGGAHTQIRMLEEKSQVSNVRGVDTTDWVVYTYVISKDTETGNTMMTLYRDGTKITSTTTPSEEKTGTFTKELTYDDDLGIVVGGAMQYVSDHYDTYKNEILGLDELYVYDTALDSSQVAALTEITKNGLKNEYNVAVEEGEVLASVNKNALDSENEVAGWYYVNSDGHWTIFPNSNIGTAKSFMGVPCDKELSNSDKKKVTYDGTGKTGFKTIDGEYVYFDLKDYSPSIFYYEKDETDTDQAVLYCAFTNNNTYGYETSPVYQKEDGQRIKVESLQAALGTFVSGLSEDSPDSRVSAVRFSTDEIPEDEINKLVLLDWTKDTIEASDILGLQRGEGSSTSYEISGTDNELNQKNEISEVVGSHGGLRQYNYGMTGGTTTWTGLQAYIDELDSRIDRDGEIHDDAKKYLIIFTDGKDTLYFDDDEDTTDEDRFKAINLANQLKEEGYTIYCVALTGGTLAAGDASVKNYLSMLAGDPDSQLDETWLSDHDANEYTNPPANDLININDYVFVANTPDELEQYFDTIRDNITLSLEQYTVQDYIDPRFDLVDANNNEIYLESGGVIYAPKAELTGTGAGGSAIASAKKIAGYESYTLADGVSYPFKTFVDGALADAELYYDDDTDLYFLRWSEEDIPGCAVGANALSVWDAQITIRAKEDFIGGNAVPSNGNDESMNYVYNEEDAGSNKTSGVTDTLLKMEDPTEPDKVTDHPSKGFPRTTVNVELSEFEVGDGSQVIYLGEDIDPWEILKVLGDKIRTVTDDTNIYWEYLSRYADKFYSKDLDYLLKEIEDALLKTGTYELPYMYLPNADDSNQTGTSAHESDPLGDLTFKWEPVSSDEVLSKNEPYTATNTKQKKYKLTVSFTPYPEKLESTTGSDEVDRSTFLTETEAHGDNPAKGLIKDEDYHNPKSAVGTEQVTSPKLTKSGNHVTDIVKGEIHLDMHLKKSDLEYLKAHSKEDDWTITYCTDLVRTYTDASGKSVETVVGTLTATYDLTKLDSAEWDDDGYIAVPATLALTKEYEELGFTEQLPIGTYSFKEKTDETVVPSPFVFNEEVEILEVTKDTEESLFTLLPDILETGETPADYAAPYDQAKGEIYLGTAEDTRPTDYLNDRLGLARISGSLELGDLEITKTVEGVVTDDPEEDPDFTFAVQLFETKPETNTDGVPLVGSYAYTVYDEDGNKVKSEDGNTEIAHGETFTLKAGQSVVIEDLPKGAYYEVTEVEAKMPGGYTPKGKNYTKSGTISGSVDKAGMIIADEVTFTNDYAATATLENSLLVKKVFDREWRDGDSFIFTLTPDEAAKAAIGKKEVEIEGYDEAAGTASITITDKDASDYTKAFGKMTFHSNGKKTTDYTFTVAETKGSESGVGYATNSYTVTLRVTDNEDGTMAVELVQDGTAKEIDEKNPFEMEFENTYTVTPTTQVLSVKKNITGDVPEGKDYTFDFTLSTNEKSGMTMPKEDTVQVTVNSKATTATADFGEITFTRAGTYEFEISENTEDPIQGFVYDSDLWTVMVEVVEEVDATTQEVSLKVESVTYTRDVETETDAAVFTNQYDPGTAVYAPQVTKAITGEVPSADSAFTFTIADTGASAGVTMPAKTSVTVTGAGSAKFGNIIFSKAGTYTFTITEEDGGLTGYTYDDSEWTLTVKVTDNDGKLEIETVSYTRGTETAEDAAEFTNTYQPEETTFAPSVKKEIDGLTPPSAGTFTFEISASNNTDAGVKMPVKKNVTVTGAGSAEFDDITFSKAGTYTFTITEEAGGLAGYTYDDQPWTLTVKVADNDGKLEIGTVSYTRGTETAEDAAVFTNIYQPEETTFAPSVKKEIDGLTPPSAGTFTFEISASNNTDAGVKMPAKKNVTVTGAGSAEFDDITFSKAGTYTFTITEEAGKLTGYTYDDSEWTLTVEVTDVDGKLQVSEASYTKGTGASAQTETDAAVFTNIYTPGAAVYVPQVTKAITGGTPPTIDTDIFTFTLTESAADLDKVLAEPLTAEVTGEGTASFDALTFTKAGTYSFTITEEDDALPGYTYDTAEWTLTVTVVDQDGKLQVDEDRTSYQKTVAGGQTVSELEAAVFENDYEAEGTEYALRVEKDITGDKPTDNKTFTFTLAADAENPEGAALPNNKTLKIKGADSGVFDEITFTKAGTYKFTITEQDDALPGYTYDTNEWTLTVVVEDIASELIVESAAYVQDGATTEYDWATFTNTYKLTPVTYRAEVQKTVEGDVPEDQTFTFTMTAKDDNPKSGASLKPGEQLTTTVVGSGKGLFDAIEFTRPGTYCYEIREHRDDLSGYTYDGTVWTMKVEVTDRDSQLETKVTYTDHTGQTADLAGFLNIYRADPVGVAPNVEKKINGNLSSAQKDFTFTLEFAEGDESGVQLPEVTSVTRTGVGTTAFDEIIFTKAGTYLFDIKEELEHIPGYTFDPSTWQLKVVVTDHGGVLGADASYTNLETGEERSQEAVFTNIYQTLSVGFEPKVIKTVIGDVPKDETFTFILLADPDNPEGAELPQETEVTITGSGETLFGDITFTEPGTYVFEIDEEQGNVSGYTYDDNAWTLTIEVIDVDGQLEVAAAVYERADEEPNETAAHFENSYRPERTAYAPVIEKVISGDTPETPTEFTFELQADPENETGAVLPAVRTVTVTGEGTAEFENIIFTKAGTYTFEVRETAGDVAGYTYDDSVWTLTVEVEDRNAALDVTKVTYTKNGANESSDTLALFENIFDEFDEPDEPSTDNEIVEPPTEPDTTDDSTTSEPPTTPDVPTDSNTTSKTGDSMNPILWVLIMILALLAAGATVFYRRRNRL